MYYGKHTKRIWVMSLNLVRYFHFKTSNNIITATLQLSSGKNEGLLFVLHLAKYRILWKLQGKGRNWTLKQAGKYDLLGSTIK